MPTMFFQLQPITLGSDAAEAYLCTDQAPNGGTVAESTSQYRPRHPNGLLSISCLRLTSHIPDPGRHCQRFYGAYSNRARVAVSSTDGHSAGSTAATHPKQDNSDFSREARSTWARLIRKIFETDPLLCTCGARMRIVSFITDPRTVDLILRHRESGRCKAQDPFEPRGPPGAAIGFPE